jgi:hypothetical protein
MLKQSKELEAAAFGLIASFDPKRTSDKKEKAALAAAFSC